MRLGEYRAMDIGHVKVDHVFLFIADELCARGTER